LKYKADKNVRFTFFQLQAPQSINMLSSLLAAAALLSPALAIVEPLNTTILGPYGNVPPVYPSREFLHPRFVYPTDSCFQQTSQAPVAGKMLWLKLKHSCLN
jgi:hypothetical protein